jgi:hypothetical protein
MTVILAYLKDAGQNHDADGSPEIVREQYALAELERQNPNAYPVLPPDGTGKCKENELSQSLQQNDGTLSPLLEELRTSFSEREHLLGHMSRKFLCDSRLENLDISYWTGVSIDNAIAAQVISTYLEIDHPLLGFFDPDSFLATLTQSDTSSCGCSSVLVNALLYWATVSIAHFHSPAGITHVDCAQQMYRGTYGQIDSLAIQFCAEAEKLWETEREMDSVLNVAAALFLSQGYTGQGRDQAALEYLSGASEMATRLGLFDGIHDTAKEIDISQMSKDVANQHLYAAWGAFNWITYVLALTVKLEQLRVAREQAKSITHRHMSVFKRQPGSPYTARSPRLPIPDGNTNKRDDRANSPDIVKLPRHPTYMGGAFPYVCRFWRIMHDMSLAYNKQGLASGMDEDPRASRFAEFKFRELLAWSGKLPNHLLRGDGSAPYAQVLQ